MINFYADMRPGEWPSRSLEPGRHRRPPRLARAACRVACWAVWPLAVLAPLALAAAAFRSGHHA
jgi:hypothetical protein